LNEEGLIAVGLSTSGAGFDGPKPREQRGTRAGKWNLGQNRDEKTSVALKPIVTDER